MNIKNLLVFCFLPILAGCAGYRAQPLKKLQTKPLETHKDISFAAKAFDANDCEMYLGRNVIQAGYTPIQVAIDNDSTKQLQFSGSEINMSLVPTNIVAESVYQSIVARALGYGIPGLLIGPFFSLLTVQGLILASVFGGGIWMLPAITGLIAAGGLSCLTASVVDSCWANSANEALLADYYGKSLRDQTIFPHAHLNGLIFVANNEFKKELVLNLRDATTYEKIVCTAHL